MLYRHIANISLMTDEGRGTPYITCIDLDHDDICRHESDVIRLISVGYGICHYQHNSNFEYDYHLVNRLYNTNNPLSSVE